MKLLLEVVRGDQRATLYLDHRGQYVSSVEFAAKTHTYGHRLDIRIVRWPADLPLDATRSVAVRELLQRLP